jgi:hypothetical protein
MRKKIFARVQGEKGGAMTITEFLEARIAEDEYAARLTYETSFVGRIEGNGSRYDLAQLMNPSRVLAECAAKRAIIARHHPDRHLENWYWSQRKCAECGGTWHKWLNNDVPTDIGPEQGCWTLRSIAAVYADHPDYQQEWPVVTQ